MEYDFSRLGFSRGDVCVVTGAASGIGNATASLAARSGLAVACWDMDEERLDAVVRAIKDAGGDAASILCDVSREQDVKVAWDATARIGSPRFLVNNAGPASSAGYGFTEGLALGAGSMVAVTEGWLVGFSEVAEAVTFTASIAGNLVATASGSAWYAAAKAAIAAYAREIAVHRRGKPRANVVAPGITVTPRTARLAESEAGQMTINRIPVGRFGEPRDVAAAICFLLSPAAAYINGVTVPVDGGLSCVA